MTGSNPPLVSAIITTYNRPTHLRDAIGSVLEQTYDTIELVVVDDHSETPAEAVVDDLELDALERCQVVRHEENRGANAARNTGIQSATGDYVAFLDDDDQWVPKKIARQVEAFDDEGEVGVVYCGVKRVFPDDTRIEIPPAVDGDMTKALLCRNVVGSMSVAMVRRDVAESVPLDERFPSWADLEWYIKLSQETAFRRVPEPLVIYECDSPERLTADFEKTHSAYTLFLETFDPLAADFGPLFRRKMRGWAAFRAGKVAFNAGFYAKSRELFLKALASYPFESEFSTYLAASLGGEQTHRLARFVKTVKS